MSVGLLGGWVWWVGEVGWDKLMSVITEFEGRLTSEVVEELSLESLTCTTSPRGAPCIGGEFLLTISRSKTERRGWVLCGED